MYRCVLVALVVVVAGAGWCEACTYFCNSADGLSYTCCDDQYSSSHSTQDNNAATPKTNVQASSHCYYYCAYNGEAYCCGDDSRPIPDNHDPHPGRCAEEAEQVCKSSGIFLHTKKAKVGKTSGSVQLAAEEGKQLETCASDGYCKADEKCCVSQCARKHVCLKSLRDEDEEEHKN